MGKRMANADNIPSHAKRGDWSVSTLQGILENERFCSDVIMQKTTMELISMRVDTNSVVDNEEKFKAMSDEIKALQDSLTEYRRSCEYEKDIKYHIADINEMLENDVETMNQYNDDLVRQIIETIKVVDRDRAKCGSVPNLLGEKKR